MAPTPERFNYGQEKFWRTNTCDARCAEPTIVGKLISIQYEINSYDAGAAHPIDSFRTYNFILEPLLLIEPLSGIFEDPGAAFSVLQQEVRKRLYAVRLGDDPDDDSSRLGRDGIDSGTSSWDDFSAVRFTEEGLEVLCASYRVAAYAIGQQVARVPYRIVAPLMRAEYRSAMQLERFLR